MARETSVQSLVESYQRLKKWYLIPPCLTLSIIKYGSRVKWSNPGKGVAPSHTLWCNSYRKGSLRITLDYGHQLYFLLIVVTYQSQLAQSLLSCSTAFLILKQGQGTYPSFHFPSYLFCDPPGQQSRQFYRFSFFFFCWLLWGLVFWPGLGDPFVCWNPIGVYASHFQGHVVGCSYTICLYDRIEISCTFPSGSLCRPRRVSPYTPSVLICCIRLLCDWSFRFCHRIAYIYCFLASYLFSFWYDWFLWRCPMLLLGGILFLS